MMLLSSTAHARGYSFSIGGRFIHVEAGRHCRSLSCVSWSDSGTRRSRRDDDDAAAPAPVTPAKPVAVAPEVRPAASMAADATPSSTLLGELTLLQRAQHALAGGAPGTALSLAGEHATRYPRSQLSRERDAAV